MPDPTKNIVLRNQLLLASLVFLFSQVVVALVINFAGGTYFEPWNWSRWDSAHYVSIAEKGYEFFPCYERFDYPSDSDAMCGNTGWFPGYPLLLRFVSLFFNDFLLVGGVVSKIFYFLSLLFVLKIADLNVISVRNFTFLSIASFSFGFVYYNAIFPVSGFVFFALASFYYYAKDSLFLCSLFCCFASFFYPTGFLLTVAFGIFILLTYRNDLNSMIRRAIPIGLSGLLGFVAAFFLIYISVGDWDAFQQVQAKYGNGTIHNPFAAIYAYVSRGMTLFTLENFMYYQTLLVIVMFATLSYFFFVKKLFKVELFLWTYIYVSVFLFFPWIMGGDLSFYRAEALLLPFVFFLKNAKTFWLLIVFSVLVVLGIGMIRLFHSGALI